MYFQDTIVAAATPAGRGAIAIVRLSGPRAIEISQRLWHPLAPNGSGTGRRLRFGEIRDPSSGAVLDRVMCVVMHGPGTFTGEDIAELHCHGGVYLIRRVVGLAAAEGARIAEPGEFSRRAFLNGRIDLTEAEAIADLIGAQSEAALHNGIAQMTGALGTRVRGLREQVVAIRAHLEAEIDFADEGLDLPMREAVAADCVRLAKDIGILYDSYVRGRVIREGARAAIIGKPNVGKSSILNLLLGSERAIVTAVPGTTRDVIEDSITVGRLPLVLYDTAGIRDSTDEVERIGILRARAAVDHADLVIAVFDASRPLDAEDCAVIELTQGRKGVALLNKRDLEPLQAREDLEERGLLLPILSFSASTGAGLPELRDILADAVSELAGGELANDVVISRQRHRDGLGHALEALEDARQGILAQMPPEIIAIDMSLVADLLASMTGEISTEDVLDAIFREFCIGK